MAEFNSKCPMCEGPINIVHFSVKCDMPIRETGWAVMGTQRNTNGSESFSCPKCECTVPCDWVYKEMALKEAQRLMKSWMGNTRSIFNKKKAEDEKPKEVKKDAKADSKTEETGAAQPQ